MKQRIATVERKTSETSIQLTLNLDGSGEAKISTGIGFLDHMLTALTRHARFDLTLAAQGDIEIDDHHTAEDCALALGSALGQSLGDCAGIQRFASACVPLDEALVRAVIDISGRPYADVSLGLKRERLGQLACENIPHFFQSLATSARITLHLDGLKGDNDHHRSEAAFKAVAIALRQAVARSGYDDVPSTKGVIAGIELK